MRLIPVQTSSKLHREAATIRESVHLRAYEVYCEVYSPQPALVEGWCRGGFHTSELIAYLYARSFPKEEWRARADEAFEGMKNV